MLLLNKEWDHRKTMERELMRSQKQHVNVRIEWDNQFTKKTGEHTGRVVFVFGIEQEYRMLAYAKLNDNTEIPIHAIKNVWRNITNPNNP